ncbi:MAG: HisA/HisF-related TIM barrel protein [Thermoplasmata archaeon]
MVEKLIPRLRIENYSVVDKAGKTLIGTEKILDFFEQISEEKEMLYILDLNGFREGTPHLDLLSEISDFIPLWVEANSRSVEDVSDILMAGAEKVVLDLGKIEKKTLMEIGEETGNIVLLLDDEGINRAEEFHNFLRRGGEVVLRPGNREIPHNLLRGIPVILDAENLEMGRIREKLNIIGRIVEMDLNEL